MNQTERREYLIRELLKEEPRYQRMSVPGSTQEQKDLLRSLMNVRRPHAASREFLAVQDDYLKESIAEKGITRLADLTPVEGDLYLWQGDITTLECDAIVNAANSGMLGCFRPLHNCIDNCIHTFSGVQLRFKCAEIMDAQIDSQIETNLVKDILRCIENLYRLDNKREVVKIQNEFYRIFSQHNLEELDRFHKQLDIIAEGSRAQSVERMLDNDKG